LVEDSENDFIETNKGYIKFIALIKILIENPPFVITKEEYHEEYSQTLTDLRDNFYIDCVFEIMKSSIKIPNNKEHYFDKNKFNLNFRKDFLDAFKNNSSIKVLVTYLNIFKRNYMPEREKVT
jgi:hypothetical protein